MVNNRVVSRWRLQFFVQVPTIKYVLFQRLIIVPKQYPSYGPLRNPFPDPRNLGRRRRIRELRIPMLGGRGMPVSLVDVTFESVLLYYHPMFATRKAVTFTRIPTIILAAVSSNGSFCHVPLTKTPTTILGSLTPLYPF